MNIKKTFVSTSTFLLTAALLSQVYSFANKRFQPTIIDYSAFNNLAENINSISKASSTPSIARENTVVTHEIINVIDKEIRAKIRNSRYAINSYTPKTETVTKKLIAITAPITVPNKESSEDLSSYEIDNQGLINLYALSIEQMAYTKFESINLASTYNEEINDVVEVAQASTLKMKPANEAVAEKEDVKEEEVKVKESPDDSKDNEELVMFDYSDKSEVSAASKSIDQKLYERPLSNTVKEAIHREMGNAPSKKVEEVDTQTQKESPQTTKIDNKEIDLDSDQNIIYDYSNDIVKRRESATRETESAISAFTAPVQNTAVNTQFVIKAKEINLNTHVSRQAHAFEFVPDYERTDRTDDQGTGEINLGYSLNGEMNTQTGVIQAQGMITTRVELNLGSSEGIEIPLINEEGIQQFLQGQGLSIEGNLILLSIDRSIVDTEIDSKFAKRLYFDKNFKLLKSNAGADYVMYAGVKSGNILIRYLLDNNESAQKIIYVGDGEMYYEDPDFTESNRETYTLTTRNLLGQKRKELVIDGSEITFFNTNIAARKKALNAYEIKVPTLTSGMRKYLEFKHLKDSIFVGTSNEKEIEVPSNDFIAKVLEMNQIDSLKERCVVQVNLSKDIREIKANGKNRSGEMFVETSFLDGDGNFSRDSDMSEKAFIVGDMEGQFNVRLDYTDGSTEFLKTFCSEGTYLVEQL